MPPAISLTRQNPKTHLSIDWRNPLAKTLCKMTVISTNAPVINPPSEPAAFTSQHCTTCVRVLETRWQRAKRAKQA